MIILKSKYKKIFTNSLNWIVINVASSKETKRVNIYSIIKRNKNLLLYIKKVIGK